MTPAQQDPAEFSAKKLALLQFYATKIEGYILMIYRSDPEKFKTLSFVLQQHLKVLQDLAKSEGEFQIFPLSGCDVGEVRCSDGLCHPQNDPTCCDANMPVME